MKKKKNEIRSCIIKDSTEIRRLLGERFDELEMSGRDIVADADTLGYSLSTSALSRYMKNGNVKGCLSQQDIIWLCYRYGIEVKLVQVKILPYNEKACIKMVKKYVNGTL